MKYSELSNFTNDELSYLTNDQLRLSKEKLKRLTEKADTLVPESLEVHLHDLCKSLGTEKIPEHFTVSEAISMIGSVFTIIETLGNSNSATLKIFFLLLTISKELCKIVS